MHTEAIQQPISHEDIALAGSVHKKLDTIVVFINKNVEISNRMLLTLEKNFNLLEIKNDLTEQRHEELLGYLANQFLDIDTRFGLVYKRFDAIDQRFNIIDERFKKIDERFDAVDKKFVTFKDEIISAVQNMLVINNKELLKQLKKA